MKKILLTFVFVLSSIAIFAQTADFRYVCTSALTSTPGDKVREYSMQASVGSNAFVQNVWLLRNGSTSDWTTVSWVDGIQIDGSYNLPTTARTWWKRDPATGYQSWGSEGYTFMTLASGSLGIGTTHPDAPLTVNGQIHAKEVKIDTNIVPDYVFEKSYTLPDLKFVEEYVNEHKHLPEIPSAKEIEKNGLMLKEMNLLLLKKVEELTLYVIDQQKQIDELKGSKR